MASIVCKGCHTVSLQPTFSSVGMGISQVNDSYEIGTIQSVKSFSSPFITTADVEGVVSHGQTFIFGIMSSIRQGVAIVGNLNPGNSPYYGVTVYDLGSSSKLPILYGTPVVNVTYTIYISVDGTGNLGYGISEGTHTLGQASVEAGLGPYYIVMGQGEGLPPLTGLNQAYWTSVSINPLNLPTTSTTSATSVTASTTTETQSQNSSTTVSSEGPILSGQAFSWSTYVNSTNSLYVSDYTSGSVSVVNVSNDQLVTRIPVGSGPDGLAFDSASGEVYVANENSGTVSVVDTKSNTVTYTIRVGSFPHSIAYDEVTGGIYGTCGFNNTVFEISDLFHSLVAIVHVGPNPFGIVASVENGDLYITNHGSNSISVVDPRSNTLVATISVGSSPLGIAESPATGAIYVVNEGSSSISVIDPSTNKLVDNFTTGPTPFSVAVDSERGYLYVSSCGSNSVSLVNTTTGATIGVAPVGTCPTGVLYVPSDFAVYVSNFGSQTLEKIFVGITFVQNGLPSGTVWGIAIGSLTRQTDSRLLTFPLTLGSYYYTITGAAGYAGEPERSQVKVMGNVTMPITYRPAGPLLVSEFYSDFAIPLFNQLSSISTLLLLVLAMIAITVELVVPGMIVPHPPLTSKEFIESILPLGEVFFSFLLSGVLLAFGSVFNVLLKYQPLANSFYANLFVLIFVIAFGMVVITTIGGLMTMYYLDFVALGAFYSLKPLLPSGLSFVFLMSLAWYVPIAVTTLLLTLSAVIGLRVSNSGTMEYTQHLPFVLMGFIADLVALPFLLMASIAYIPIFLFVVAYRITGGKRSQRIHLPQPVDATASAFTGGEPAVLPSENAATTVTM